MTTIELSFAPEMEEAILSGYKACTTRRTRHGAVGDTFVVRGRMYRILHIHSAALISIAHSYYAIEGFSSPEEFERFWESAYGEYWGASSVFIHMFAYVCDIGREEE